MTSMTLNKAKNKSGFSVLASLPIIFAVLIFIAIQFLPFVNQPELGATTIPTLMASRANNELEVPTSGFIMFSIVSAALLLMGVWNAFNRQLTRAISYVMVLLGVLVLQYFLIFIMDYQNEGATYIGQMGIGFFMLAAIGVGLIIQVAIPRESGGREFQLRTLIANQESAIVIALVLLILIVGTSNPRFLSTNNVLDVLQGNAYIAVAAIGMSMVIITGNIDISVGSLIALLAVISGRLVVDLQIEGVPVEVIILISWTVPLILGSLIGAFIGFMVAFLKVPSIVVTLGMFSILKGVLIIWAGGDRVTDMPDGYFLAQMRPLDIPMTIWFMLILTVIAGIWLRYSSAGRSFYALGGNADAARLSGLSQRGILIQVFSINGFFAGIAAVMYATQLSVIQATPVPGLELAIITAAVVGGVSILGGKGTVIGAMLAAILLNAIRSGMVFINVSPFWIQAVQGMLILVTVLIDLIRRKRQSS
jgi:ribose/xylose/arabinose/galactoside ABC-type transport system permease subunit